MGAKTKTLAKVLSAVGGLAGSSSAVPAVLDTLGKDDGIKNFSVRDSVVWVMESSKDTNSGGGNFRLG